MTPSEHAEVVQRAAAADLRLSDYVRFCCLNRPLPRSGRPKSEARALVAELARVGNNVNQLAHHANALGELRSERALLQALDELGATTRRIMGL